MWSDGYHGWTQYQTAHEEITKAWICPDLPCFGIDQLPPEAGPWRALAEEWSKAKVSRLWDCYGEQHAEHYSWWTPV